MKEDCGHSGIRLTTDKWNFVKSKNFCSAKEAVKWRDRPKNGRKYLQAIHLTVNSYIQQTTQKNKKQIKQPNQQMGWWNEQIALKDEIQIN